MDKQQSEFSNNSQLSQLPFRSAKKTTILIFILILSLFLSIVLLVFIIKNGKSKLEKTAIQPSLAAGKNYVTQVPTVLDITKTPIASPEAKLINPVIVYFKDKNLWSVKTDGTVLRQLTTDGDQKDARYTGLTFKNKNEISFAKCSDAENRCVVKTKNLLTNNETEEFNIENMIISLKWNKNNTLLAYIANSSQDGQSLYFTQAGNQRKVLTFEPSLGRGGGYTDELALFWSPDDRYLLIINTITQPNQKNDKTSIWVIDQSGNILTTIAKEFASKARWINNTEFVYQSKSIFRHTVSGYDQELSQQDGYLSSVNGNDLLIWAANNDGTTKVMIYSMEQKLTSPVQDNLMNPSWYDKNSVIAIKTSPDPNSMFGFSTYGLITYNLTTKKELILDSNSNIYDFIIQPE